MTAKQDGMNALMYASKGGHWDIMSLLLDDDGVEADVNLQDRVRGI